MKRLDFSQNDRVFLGVCGGIGEYLGVDGWIIRTIWLLLTFYRGVGLGAYLIVAAIIAASQARR